MDVIQNHLPRTDCKARVHFKNLRPWTIVWVFMMVLHGGVCDMSTSTDAAVMNPSYGLLAIVYD